MNSMVWKKEKLSAPSRNARPHQIPDGNCRTMRSRSRPAGSARSMETVIG
jgi:hypothetical protein